MGYDSGPRKLHNQGARVRENRSMKKSYTATFKAHAVWERFKETKTLNQLASEYGGELINRKRVQRSMREMGIAGIAPGPNLSKWASQHRIPPYLLRGVTASVPNQIWGADAGGFGGGEVRIRGGISGVLGTRWRRRKHGASGR